MASTASIRLSFAGGTLVLTGTARHAPPPPPPGVWTWDARVGTWRAEALHYAVLRGLLRAHYGATFEDAMPRPARVLWPKLDLPPLRPEQQAALAAWTRAGRRGMVIMPTGTGKTEVALAAMAAAGVATLVVVPVRDLMYQWQRRILRGTGYDAGLVGDALFNLRPVTVTTYDSAYIHAGELGARFGLLVFDEAHHLTAYKVGGKVRKTENYKLVEALKDHARDLMLLSATPHQGNHFQFWMLIQLLNPTLFGSPEEMLEHRHRLNTVMFRRTKADACQPDGSPLFSRRWVHTESFVMGEEERKFYEKLREYLEDGFDLARRQGGQGRALGFLMAIFQKIAASSFAAVRRTLKRRLLMLTLHEAFLRDKDLDIEGRERLTNEARELIHQEFNLSRDSIGRSEVDRVLADLKYRLVKKLDEEALEMASDPYGSEFSAAHAEEAASAVVEMHLPEERMRIGELLAVFPQQRETKAQKLLDGLGILWRQNPNEKIVVFATYLGTVDLIAREIEQTFPGQGVAVLRGGDHGAKLAAERRFRLKDGPRVLVCTAAGREGINLQFARILFNFDLPWNPMDMEQRIGRIHRYGQNYTAQVYNLVLSDTIEGRIFLLLEEKLTEIARTVGKVDDQGNVAEDLRAQILGQLSERLNYDRLYQEALSDPELKRTQVELEAALSNSREARQVVFDLFQDLDGFSLDDYKPFSDISSSMERLVQFISAAVADRQQRMVKVDEVTYDLVAVGGARRARFTLNRDTATSNDDLELMGLDHPLVQEELGRWRSVPPEEVGIAVEGDVEAPVLLSFWMVEVSAGKGERRVVVQPIAVKQDGTRVPAVERQCERYLHAPTTMPKFSPEQRLDIFSRVVEPTLQRELKHKGAANGDGSYSAELIGYVEIVATTT